MHRGLVCISVLWMGCAETPFVPSPYLPAETTPPEPQYSSDEIGLAIEEALSTLYDLNAQPVLSAYTEVIDGQDDYCPRYYSGDAGYYWFDQCQSTTGTSFSGYGFYTYYDAQYSPGDGNFMTGEVVTGASSITTPEGHMLNLSGTVGHIYRQHETNPTESYQTVVNGTFDWNGPSAIDTWLNTSIELDLNVFAYIHTEANGKYIGISGGIAGLDGDFNAIVFDQIGLIDAALGGACEQEPYGAISVRSPEGEWYDVLFDGVNPNTFENDPSQCDGRGHVSFRGTSIGTVAIDFSNLYLFETSPW